MKKTISVLTVLVLFIFLLIFSKKLFFDSEEKTPPPKPELLTSERLEEYAEGRGMDWQIKQEKTEEDAEIVRFFTISDPEGEILFRISNAANPAIEGWSLNLFSYVKPLSDLPDGDEERERMMMDAAADLSGVRLKEGALEELDSFKEKMTLSDCDSFHWHTEDPHFIMILDYARDRKSSSSFRLMDIKVWNGSFFREIQQHIEKAVLRTADTKNQEKPVEIRRVKELASESENSAEEKPKENRIYSTAGRFKYGNIEGWTASEEYVSFGDFAVDPNLYETGSIYDEEGEIKVLIPTFYRKYPVNKESSCRFLLYYSEKADLFLLKTMTENTK
ncbi:MAG: hypothetical protein Q4A78_04600 [Peptostreptococcaceae bacterium]|nr:hypothetical protein [Peptostreptococcaceae bacterium]